MILTVEDMFRYFRVAFGSESLYWSDGTYFEQTQRELASICRNEDFPISKAKQESLNIVGEAFCPRHSQNDYISGQWWS